MGIATITDKPASSSPPPEEVSPEAADDGSGVRIGLTAIPVRVGDGVLGKSLLAQVEYRGHSFWGAVLRAGYTQAQTTTPEGNKVETHFPEISAGFFAGRPLDKNLLLKVGGEYRVISDGDIHSGFRAVLGLDVPLRGAWEVGVGAAYVSQDGGSVEGLVFLNYRIGLADKKTAVVDTLPPPLPLAPTALEPAVEIKKDPGHPDAPVVKAPPQRQKKPKKEVKKGFDATAKP